MKLDSDVNKESYMLLPITIPMICVSIQGEVDRESAQRIHGEDVKCDALAVFLGNIPTIMDIDYKLEMPIRDWEFASTMCIGRAIMTTVLQVIPDPPGLPGEVQP